jgi:CubicO group peptidase (beta-lactamase class C family)
MTDPRYRAIEGTPPISRRDLLVGLSAAGFVGAVGTAGAETKRVLIWHGKTHAEFVRLVDDGMRDGYRIRSLSLYGAPSAPLYAALMTKPEKPTLQRWFASLSTAQLQAQLEHQANEKLGPALIAATGPAASPLFAAVFESHAALPLTQLGLKSGRDMDPNTIEGMVYQSKMKGLILRCAAVYGTAADRRFAAIWGPNEDRVAWDVDGLADDAHAFRERLAAQSAGWCRLKSVAVGPDGRFLSIYHHEQIGPWTVRENLNATGLQREIDAHGAQGLHPIVLQAGGGRADAAKFAAIFVKSEVPMPPVWNATGPIANAAIDEAMKKIMTDGMVRQAGLAIVKGAQLVFARGYTFAQPDWPVAQPTTTFRLASVSKTVAAMAIYQLIDRGQVKLGDRMQDILQLRTPAGGPPKDPRFNKVTIQHLLEHSGGLPLHVLTSVSIRDAHAAAQPRRAWHFPITAAMANSYLASLGLVSDPGAKNEYSNTGYFMLGQVLAKVHAAPTPAVALEKHLFAPLGIKRIRRARSLLADQPTDEARYRVGLGRDHIRVLSLARSVMSDARPLVPMGYGQEPMEIHESDGGLSAAMTDLARLIAIMISRRDSPALRGDTVREMLSNAATRHGHGFDAAADRGNGAFKCYKGGSLPSTWSLLQFDGDFGFCVAWSGGVPEKDASWYPNLPTVMRIARREKWGDDLFPEFGMPSLA